MIYAVGDIHGRLDLLTNALTAIRAHAGGDPEGVVFLGDYIDRGPRSKEVVDTLMQLAELPYVVALKGNHEVMMIEAFYRRDRQSKEFWISNGGLETIESYGGSDGWGKPSLWPCIPHVHIHWMEALPTVMETHGRLFVHAGFTPGKALEEQTEDEVIWIRDRFLRAADAFKDWPHIVHGHTWGEDGKYDYLPNLLSWRTNLDSCAYHGGCLSVGVFSGTSGGPSHLILVTEKDSTVVKAEEFDERFCQQYLESLTA